MEQVAIIFKFTALHWKWFAGGFVFLLIYSSARIFIPYYTGQVIAEIVGAQGRQEHDFMRLILIMIGLTALRFVFSCCYFYGTLTTLKKHLTNFSCKRDKCLSFVFSHSLIHPYLAQSLADFEEAFSPMPPI